MQALLIHAIELIKSSQQVFLHNFPTSGEKKTYETIWTRGLFSWSLEDSLFQFLLRER